MRAQITRENMRITRSANQALDYLGKAFSAIIYLNPSCPYYCMEKEGASGESKIRSRGKSLHSHKPIILVNFKTYIETTDKNAVKLAKACEKIARAKDVTIIVAVAPTDIRQVAKAVK